MLDIDWRVVFGCQKKKQAELKTERNLDKNSYDSLFVQRKSGKSMRSEQLRHAATYLSRIGIYTLNDTGMMQS